MRSAAQQAAFGLGMMASLWVAACGGGGSGSSSTPPPPTKTTPSVSITPAPASITASEGLTATITVTSSAGTPTGTVTLSSGSYSSAATALVNGSAALSISAGALAPGTDTLTATYAPDSASSSSYNSATGTAPVTVTLLMPTVSVAPSPAAITTSQAVNVSITVTGSATTPTGSVVLSGGSFTSSSTALVNGSASIPIAAGSLPVGSDSLKATFTPDANSSSLYAGASGSGSVTVSSLIAPSIIVSPGAQTITTNQSLAVTVTVAGGSGNPTPTGSVTLSSGSYASAPVALNSSGIASITIPTGSLATGADTLIAKYTPDANSSSLYTNASGTGSVTVNAAATTYLLTIDSTAPSSGISIGSSPADNNSLSSGSTPFTLTYNAGTQVTLSAALSDNGYNFVSWTGCASTTGTTCSVTMNANTTVTVSYNATGISSIVVTPNTATIGTQQTFTATINGTGSFSKNVSWSVAAPTGSALSPGTIASSGASTALYNTPYPAPSTVTITATSTEFTTVSGSVTVTLNPSATAAGPALSVDVNTPNTPSENPHSISSYVYGMNGYDLDTASATLANPGIIRWGGDDVSRYNYTNNMTNSAADYYFENFLGAGGMLPNPGGSTSFTQFLQANQAVGSATLGTVPVIGWVANNTQFACSFTQSQFPNQQSFESGCGNGVLTTGADLNGSNGTSSNQIALITSLQETPPSIATAPAPGSVTSTWANGTWSGGWVNSLVTNANFGSGASGKGVAVWDLDNEPTWWDAVHRDVHPNPFTYDEVTNNGIGTALAIKTADPTALVSGPVMDNWWMYFYSKADYENGQASKTGNCPGEPWNDPTDRAAHGGVAMLGYYLQQFQQYSQSYGIRLLDYLSVHAYDAPDYNGTSVGLTTAGDTQEQIARMNGTRVFWDPTYTDPNYTAPNYSGAPATSTNCSPAAQPPQIIPMLESWVQKDYPGTKISIDEYNFGGLESINGAVVEADILGIFGRQGLDMGALWPTAAYAQQVPGNYAFAMYRNYDGNHSAFGDVYLQSTSTGTGGDGEGQLAVYAAQRSSDNAITVMVINKTYGSLTSTISLANFVAPGGTTAQVYQYSNANLNAIQTPAATAVTPPSTGGSSSTISSYTFPAQSITLFVIPD